MISGSFALISPQDTLARPGQRQRWADNLRVLVITTVVVFHTGTAYLGGTSWYFMQRATSGIWSAAVFPAEIGAAFALGPLFLVAGWFSARSPAHRGPGGFAGTRLLRLVTRPRIVSRGNRHREVHILVNRVAARGHRKPADDRPLGTDRIQVGASTLKYLFEARHSALLY